MNVLVIGSGGREHALAWRLSRSPRVNQVSTCPGNGGTGTLGPRWTDIDPSDVDTLLTRIREEQIGFVVIGPEAPLVDGLADRLRDEGILTFGPGAEAALLEGSKIHAKEFMTRHGIPTARYAVVESESEIEPALATFDGPTVVKADGLAAGKGVIVSSSHEEAAAAAREMICESRFGEAGRRVILEERLDGVEMTLLVFVSGAQYQLLETAQDYKPLLDGNEGPNTGGMGSYSPTTLIDEALREEIVRDVVKPTVAGLQSDGVDYRGVLYFGFMLTPNGPSVLEYNVRFGDPETQPLMFRLKSDLLSVFEAIENRTLDEVELEWDSRSALCLVLASGGYPGSYEKGCAIEGPVHSSDDDEVQVFHAGTELGETGVLTTGGRVFGVTALGKDLAEARSKAYARADEISFSGKTHRNDIGVFGISRDA